MTLQIHPIPAFQDNYIWLLRNSSNADVAVVDPGDGLLVLKTLEQDSLRLTTILITHHHADHIGGIAALQEAYPEVRVIGPQSSRIPAIQVCVAEGDVVATLGLPLQVLSVPGHTLDHLAYYLPPGPPCPSGALFCGDTLFSAGCGRMYEGTAAVMLDSLEKLQKLPPQTLVYCAHEYTQANLRFALTVEPDNPDLPARVQQVQALRAAGQPSLPSNIDLECRTNPFLRCHIGVVARSVAQHRGQAIADPVATFAGLRAWKDHF